MGRVRTGRKEWGSDLVNKTTETLVPDRHTAVIDYSRDGETLNRSFKKIELGQGHEKYVLP